MVTFFNGNDEKNNCTQEKKLHKEKKLSQNIPASPRNCRNITYLFFVI